jgi:hypothetical protein
VPPIPASGEREPDAAVHKNDADVHACLHVVLRADPFQCFGHKRLNRPTGLYSDELQPPSQRWGDADAEHHEPLVPTGFDWPAIYGPLLDADR